MHNEEIIHRILKKRVQSSCPVSMEINGISMQPVLYQGDIIQVSACLYYQPGDILVFNYIDNHQEKIIVHRLLWIKNQQFYCKGDNTFRLEIINQSQIIGAVKGASRNDQMLNLKWPQEQINKVIIMSLAVYGEFVRAGFDTMQVIEGNAYRSLQEHLLELMCYKNS